MSKIKIGVLAVQGDVTENFLATMASMSELGIDGSVIQVKTVEQISTLDGLIIPGAIVIYFVRNYIAKGFALGRV